MLAVPKFINKYKNVVFDWETNGLLHEVTQCWCMTAYDLDTDEYFTFSQLTGPKESWHEDALDLLENAKLHSSHNGYGFDYPLMEMMYGAEWSMKPDMFRGNTKLEIYDTYILSQMADPEREDCNAVQINKDTGEKKRVGKHSVESYGYQFGVLKKYIQYWDKFSGDIIDRCEGDVAIQARVHKYLMKKLHRQAEMLNDKTA